MKFLIYLFFYVSFFPFSFSKNSWSSSKNFFADKSKLENPFDLRDPFRPPAIKKTSKKEGEKKNIELNSKGEFSNVEELSPETLSITEMKVVGVLIGKERRVMVSTGETNSKVITLKEGVKIGRDGAELKAILPGGIILVEKITNIYGEEEYLETVIPISK